MDRVTEASEALYSTELLVNVCVHARSAFHSGINRDYFVLETLFHYT